MDKSKEVRESKIKQAVADKLDQLGALIDSELPEYILVMIANKKSKEAMEQDLLLFLDTNTKPFIDWLHDYLCNLDNETEFKGSVHKNSPINDKKKKNDKEKHKEKDRERVKVKESDNRRGKEIEKTEKDKREKIKSRPLKEEKKVVHVTHERKNKERSRSPVARKLKRITPVNETNKIVQSSVKVIDRPNKSLVNNDEMKIAASIFKRDIAKSVKSLMSYEDICPKTTTNKTVPEENRSSVFDRLGKDNQIRRKRSRSISPMVVETKREELSPEKPSIKKRLGEHRREISPKINQDTDTNFIVDISGAADLLRSKERNKLVASKALTSRLGPKVSRSHSPDNFVSVFDHKIKPEVQRLPSSPSPPSPRLHFATTKRNSNSTTSKMMDGVINGSGQQNHHSSELYQDEFNDDEEDEGVITCDPSMPNDDEDEPPIDSPNMDVGDDAMSASVQSNTRCRFWPSCKNKHTCPFIHPSDPCKMFPNCKFGAGCFYIHPNCRFDASCSKPDCPFTHYSPRPFVASKPASMKLISQQVALCTYFPNCKNTNCTFYHPHIQCKFGLACANKGSTCPYNHPNLPHRSELKWTRNSTKSSSATGLVQLPSSTDQPSNQEVAVTPDNEMIGDDASPTQLHESFTGTSSNIDQPVA